MESVPQVVFAGREHSGVHNGEGKLLTGRSREIGESLGDIGVYAKRKR